MVFTACPRSWAKSRGFLFFAWALLLASMPAALGQAPRLELDAATNGVFQLSLAGASGANANLEGSRNLQDWFTLDSAAPENGVASFVFEDSELGETWFFRAASGPAPAGPRVSVRVDANLRAGFLLTPETGGSIQLTDAQGIIYEFTASSNLVREPVAVQMTVITNFTSFPDHDGSRAAVRFSPDGQGFLGPAQLRIIFPESIPPAEMLAYSFEDAGNGFHLLPSRPGTNEVAFAVSHFSGKGVARFSNAKVPNFDQAWDGAKSAIRAAEHRNAVRDRAAIKEHYVDETITEQQLDQRFKENELRSLEEIYRDAVKPYEKAGANNCAIGQAVVMGELDRLGSRWAKLTGGRFRESPYYPKSVEYAPKVRCACAHRLIERCENEPGVSGGMLLKGMEGVLLDSLVYTGRTDAQGCDLGSDEQIIKRLISGKCFGKWEGTIRLTRIKTQKGMVTIPMGTSTHTRIYDDEVKEIFEGRIAGVNEERIFINNDGKLEEFWSLALVGTYPVGHREHRKFVIEDADTIMTTTVTEDASAAPLAVGVTTLHLIDGKFEGLGPGGGTTELGFSLPYNSLSVTTFQCKTPRPPNNPCPRGYSNTSKHNYSLFQGYFVGKNDPKLSVTVTPTGVSLTWKRRIETPSDTEPPTVLEEEVSVSFHRGQ